MSIDIDKDFNVCDINKYISKIKGLKSNSSSPSDTWIVYFKDYVTYNLNNIKKGFLKIFIDTDDPTQKEKLALKYELNIYKKVINNLIKYNICPNFVRYLSYGEKCSYENLLQILDGKLQSDDKELLDLEQCKYNLNRNINFILNLKADRPSIQSERRMLRIIDFSKQPYKYNIILLEDMENSIFLNKWLTEYGQKKEYEKELWNILFQIVSACYSMSLSKLVHNDLHAGNIFIKYLDRETKFVYNIDGENFVIKTNFQAFIYDFDRGYKESLGDNPLLTGRILCEKFSQCNIFVENKDIIKILCYVYKQVVKNVKDNLLNIISYNEIYKDVLKDTYNLMSPEDGLRKCYLQYENDREKFEALPIDWYKNYNDTYTILKNISLNLDTYSEDFVSPNNIFTCDKKYFDSEGNIIEFLDSGEELKSRIFKIKKNRKSKKTKKKRSKK